MTQEGGSIGTTGIDKSPRMEIGNRETTYKCSHLTRNGREGIAGEFNAVRKLVKQAGRDRGNGDIKKQHDRVLVLLLCFL